MRARRNGDAGTWLQGNDLLSACLTPPHLTVATHDVPDLIHRMVGHRTGDPARSQLKVRHSSASELKQDPYV